MDEKSESVAHLQQAPLLCLREVVRALAPDDLVQLAERVQERAHDVRTHQLVAQIALLEVQAVEKRLGVHSGGVDIHIGDSENIDFPALFVSKHSSQKLRIVFIIHHKSKKNVVWNMIFQHHRTGFTGYIAMHANRANHLAAEVSLLTTAVHVFSQPVQRQECFSTMRVVVPVLQHPATILLVAVLQSVQLPRHPVHFLLGRGFRTRHFLDLLKHVRLGPAELPKSRVFFLNSSG
mmetsp:Transcript_24868/g.41436  ORF Transcript_24868/g.41436 Transcript_24868/m.41436 type:complete len:235 (-) Transcript_24868:1167-1871(-)